MAFSDYSITPSANLSIGGLSLAEGGTDPATINNAIRQIMADGKALSESIPDPSNFVAKENATFTGQPKVTGRGAVLHHNNSANASGRVFIQAAGSAQPTMQNGDWLIEY